MIDAKSGQVGLRAMISGGHFCTIFVNLLFARGRLLQSLLSVCIMTEPAHPPLLFGILSTANIAKKLALAMAACPDTRLVAVASRSFERAEAFITVSQLGAGVRPYGSYQALLDDPRVDAVYLPLPTSLHVEWVCKAAVAGKKYILVEKPVAVSTGDLEMMLGCCREHGSFLLDGTMFVHHERTLHLQRLLATPRFQSVHRAQCNFSFRGDDSFFENNIRGDSGLDPLGALGDLGWYCIRYSVLLFEKMPTHVTAVCRRYSPCGKIPYDLSATLFYDDDNDCTFLFDCSFLQGFRQSACVSIRPVQHGGADKIITCDDFVIPRSMLSSNYTVESSDASAPFADEGGRVLSAVEKVSFGECVQEQQMLLYLASLRTQGTGAPRHQEVLAGMRKTQVIMDAVLAAARVSGPIEVVRL